MTKELGAIILLTLVVLTSWVGWLFFERASVLAQTDYVQKTSRPLSPFLRIEVLQKAIQSGD